MHKLYEEGLIDKEAWTQEWSTYVSKGKSGRYGVCFSWDVANIAAVSMDDLIAGKGWVPLPALTADVRNITPANGSFTSGFDRGRCVITANAKNPALICAWLDQMYDPIQSPQNNWGTYGEDDEFDIFEEGTNANGEFMLKHTWLGDASPVEVREAECVGGPLAILDSYYGVYVTCPDDAQYRLDWIKDIYTPDMNTKYVFPNILMTADDAKTLSNLNPDIDKCIKEARANGIMNGFTDADFATQIPADKRPLFHLTPYIGWMNDPNGFSQYNGSYHLFYQYYPYKKKWGPMHWGHAVTKDLLKWEFLPAAIAPDTGPDSGGCFSGSALSMDNGKHLLLYTGVVKLNDMDEDTFLQTQCLAEGDGVDYVKYEGNPVIDHEGSSRKVLSKYDFRDPKMWREKDGTYRCVIGGCTNDKKGRILYFRSENGYDWKFVSVLAENDGSLGTMWECPDFFELDGKYVLLTSPQDVRQDKKYNCGNIVVAMIGTFDEETGKFHKETEQLVDAGIDFYATQTLLAEDGRRIMSAWMQNWDSIVYTIRSLRWFGR